MSTIEGYQKNRGVSGKKLNFRGEFSCNISFMERTFKSKVYVLLGTLNLFDTDWIAIFDLLKLPVNSFCKKADLTVKEKSEKTEKYISDLKNEFPHLFSESLGQCTKSKVRFKLKDNIRPVFKAKRNISFSALDAINQELEH